MLALRARTKTPCGDFVTRLYISVTINRALVSEKESSRETDSHEWDEISDGDLATVTREMLAHLITCASGSRSSPPETQTSQSAARGGRTWRCVWWRYSHTKWRCQGMVVGSKDLCVRGARASPAACRPSAVEARVSAGCIGDLRSTKQLLVVSRFRSWGHTPTYLR